MKVGPLRALWWRLTRRWREVRPARPGGLCTLIEAMSVQNPPSYAELMQRWWSRDYDPDREAKEAEKLFHDMEWGMDMLGRTWPVYRSALQQQREARGCRGVHQDEGKNRRMRAPGVHHDRSGDRGRDPSWTSLPPLQQRATSSATPSAHVLRVRR